MNKQAKEKYGGLFVYEIKVRDTVAYVAANPDQVGDVLNSVDFPKDVLENAPEINIRKMGGVSLTKLTLERLASEPKE